MDRSRSRGSVHAGHFQTSGTVTTHVRGYWWPDVDHDVTVNYSQQGSSFLSDTRETLADGTGMNQFHNCVHDKLIQFEFPGLSASRTSPFDYWHNYDDGARVTYALNRVEGCSFAPWDYYPSLLNMGLFSTEGLPPVNWDALARKVGDQLSGGMTASSNMLTNLFQLAQTVEMIKHPWRLLNSDWRRAGKKLSASRLAKAGANVWLEYRYGWTPFLADIRAVAHVMKDVRKHLDYLNQTSGSWSSLGARQVDEATLTSPLYTAYGTPAITSRLESVRRSCGFSLDFYREKTLRSLNTLNLVMQRLGCNDVLLTLWDLVPFSFCADWFIDVSSSLASDPIYWDFHKIRQMGYSTKHEWRASYKADVTASTWTGVTTKSYSSGPVVVRKRYERTAGYPPASPTAGFFGGLNLIHLVDAATLIAQQI